MISDILMLMKGVGTFGLLVVHLLALLMTIFLVLPFHEWAHAWVASLLGDKEIKYRGRLSLNPMSHIDYMGALCLILFGIGWAKPVPVDDRKFKNPKFGMALVALAGPLANLFAAFIGGALFFGIAAISMDFCNTAFGVYVLTFIKYYMVINTTLAVFNLLPIPPLDGSKILFAFLPDRFIYFIYQYRQIFSVVLFVLLFLGFLDGPITVVETTLNNLIADFWSFVFMPFIE